MRLARWIGIAGAVVYAAGFILVSSVPGGGDVDASDFEEFYITDDNTGLPIIGVFLLTAGALALLWFFQSLRTAIATPDAGAGWGAAALGLAIVLTGGAMLSGPSGVQAFSDEEFVGAPIAHTFAQAGFAAMLVPGSIALGLAVALLSWTGSRAGVLPSWVAIVGYVAAALQLVAIIWIPSFAIPLWVLLAGIAGTREQAVPASEGVPRP